MISDFDDNVGHWQVMKHPTKAGWSRVLYSCKVKLFPWIPEFVVNFLTKKALTESTGWVKRVSEKEQEEENNKKNSSLPKFPQMNLQFDKSKLPSWMNKLQGGFSTLSTVVSNIDEDSTSVVDVDSKNKKSPKSVQNHMHNALRSSLKLAPFMRFNRRGGKLC